MDLHGPHNLIMTLHMTTSTRLALRSICLWLYRMARDGNVATGLYSRKRQGSLGTHGQTTKLGHIGPKQEHQTYKARSPSPRHSHFLECWSASEPISPARCCWVSLRLRPCTAARRSHGSPCVARSPGWRTPTPVHANQKRSGSLVIQGTLKSTGCAIRHLTSIQKVSQRGGAAYAKLMRSCTKKMIDLSTVLHASNTAKQHKQRTHCANAPAGQSVIGGPRGPLLRKHAP